MSLIRNLFAMETVLREIRKGNFIRTIQRCLENNLTSHKNKKQANHLINDLCLSHTFINSVEKQGPHV